MRPNHPAPSAFRMSDYIHDLRNWRTADMTFLTRPPQYAAPNGRMRTTPTASLLGVLGMNVWASFGPPTYINHLRHNASKMAGIAAMNKYNWP